MDCTVAWEAVRHHKSQSLNAKLETLRLGRLAVPKFPPLPLLQLDDDSTTDLNGVFAACRKVAFTIVEVENMMAMEYQLEQCHVAGDAAPAELTPMKLQMLFQAHRRFVFSHRQSLQNALKNLARFQEALLVPQGVGYDSNSNNGADEQWLPLKTGAPSAFNLRASLISQPSIVASLMGEADEFSSSSHLKMTAACDLFVSLCHKIEDRGSRARRRYLTNCIYALKSLDLELLSKFKHCMNMLLSYFEERDRQELSLLNLYHEIHRITDIMKFDMSSYVQRVSSDLVIGELWDLMNVSDDYLAAYRQSSAAVRGTKVSNHAGWQSGADK
jgi:hypothetical protein